MIVTSTVSVTVIPADATAMMLAMAMEARILNLVLEGVWFGGGEDDRKLKGSRLGY